MKIYVAGRLGSGEAGVKEMIAALEALGHKVLYDWTLEKSVTKPYLRNIPINRPIAQKMLDASWDCDILVLLVGKDIYGALIELGIALGEGCKLRAYGEKSIYVVGVDPRQSLFFTLDPVELIDTPEQLITVIGPANEPEA